MQKLIRFGEDPESGTIEPGEPQVVCPFVADQPYCANRLTVMCEGNASRV